MRSILRNLFNSSPGEELTAQGGYGRAEAGGKPGAVALQGDIAFIPLEDLFQFVSMTSLTGRLDVRSPANSGCFFFRQGALIHGVLQVSQHRIGEILVESKAISQVQLEECLRLHEQERPRKRIGQFLLEKGYIKPAKLDRLLIRQIKEAFFETLAWRQGNFVFYPQLLPPTEELQIRARVDRLLLEGMVHIDDVSSSLE